MKKSKFRSLLIIKDDNMIDEKLYLGDKFLFGENMILQIDKKEIGNEISYYEVNDKKSNGNVLYTLCYDVLEEG